MCGIAGIFQTKPWKNKNNREDLAIKIRDSLKRRGPDSGGIWSDDDLPLTLCHRRLSIIDLSPEGHQPMISATGRYVISFNGEIYNFLEIRKELEIRNIEFKGRSDTEILLSAFENFGIAQTLQKIKGMFAIALFDKIDRKLYFIRDHLGKKPLYIGFAGDDLVFASELKAFREHPEFSPELNNKAIEEYLKFGYISAPLSIYNSVVSLIPGGLLTIDLNELGSDQNLEKDVTKYWDAKNSVNESRAKIKENKNLSEDEIYKKFQRILTDSVEKRMISDVSLGAFLSGGIDSSAIVSLMQSLSPRPIKTFTIGFEEEGFNESEKAKSVANHLGCDHHEIMFTAKDAINMIPKIIDIYDEPFSDVSQIPTSLLSSFTKDHVSVALSGDGGDEMFGGYNRYIAAPSIWNKTRFMPWPIGNIAAGTINLISGKNWDEIGKNITPQMGEKMQKLASILPLRNKADIYEKLLSKNDNSERLINIDEPDNLSFSEQMMFYDSVFYLPSDILVKMDRASMYYSLEARAPLLDIDMYKFAWSLPEHYKIRDGKGKYLLRKLLGEYIDKDIINQPKQGFNVPIGSWLKDSLREWAEDLLSEENIKKHDFIDYQQVKTMWDSHISGKKDHGHNLWNILVLLLWINKYASPSMHIK